MDIKVGDKFLCVSDFILVSNNTILFSKDKYYSVVKIVDDYEYGNYFDTIRNIRLKKLNKFYNV